MLELQGLSQRVIGAAIHVHQGLGAGFLEKIYEEALCHRLRQRGIRFVRQHAIDVVYDGVRVGRHQLDLFVESEMVVELKVVRTIEWPHIAVVKSYLRAVNRQHGLILNFAHPKLEIKRVIAPSPAFLPSWSPDKKV